MNDAFFNLFLPKLINRIRNNVDCQGHVNKIDNLFDIIMQEKKNVETALCSAYSMFPEIPEIKKFIGMYEETFRHTINISNEAVRREWDRNYDEEDIGALVDKIAGTTKGKHVKKPRVKDSSMPSFDLGIESPDTECTEAKIIQEGYKMVGREGGDVDVSDGKEVGVIRGADVRLGGMDVTGDGQTDKSMVAGVGNSGIINQITTRTGYDSVDIVTPLNNEERLVFMYFCSIIKKKKKGEKRVKET